MISGKKKLKNTGNKIDLNIITSAKKSALLSFNYAQESLKNNIPYKKPPMINVVHEPSYEIVSILNEIKDQNTVKKKEVGIFIFNTNDKSLEYSTKTRSFTNKFSEMGMIYKLVKKLIDTEGFRQTRFLREDIGSKSNESVRKKIGEFNEKIRNEFKLDKDFYLITSDPGASVGYRINPKIKIQVID